MKTWGMITLAIFWAYDMTMAQGEVQAYNKSDAGKQSYRTFYWVDETNETETLLQEGSDMEMSKDRMKHRESREGMMENRKDMMDHKTGMAFYGDHEAIRTAILHEMLIRGFQPEPENPDLLVNFQVFDQPAEISSFPDEKFAGNRGLDQPSAEMIEVGAGTLLIAITERESGEMVSSGFLSEALSFDPDDKAKPSYDSEADEKHATVEKHYAENYNEKVEIIRAVVSIFDQLKFGESDLGSGR